MLDHPAEQLGPDTAMTGRIAFKLLARFCILPSILVTKIHHDTGSGIIDGTVTVTVTVSETRIIRVPWQISSLAPKEFQYFFRCHSP